MRFILFLIFLKSYFALPPFSSVLNPYWWFGFTSPDTLCEDLKGFMTRDIANQILDASLKLNDFGAIKSICRSFPALLNRLSDDQKKMFKAYMQWYVPYSNPRQAMLAAIVLYPKRDPNTVLELNALETDTKRRYTVEELTNFAYLAMSKHYYDLFEVLLDKMGTPMESPKSLDTLSLFFSIAVVNRHASFLEHYQVTWENDRFQSDRWELNGGKFSPSIVRDWNDALFQSIINLRLKELKKCLSTIPIPSYEFLSPLGFEDNYLRFIWTTIPRLIMRNFYNSRGNNASPSDRESTSNSRQNPAVPWEFIDFVLERGAIIHTSEIAHYACRGEEKDEPNMQVLESKSIDELTESVAGDMVINKHMRVLKCISPRIKQLKPKTDVPTALLQNLVFGDTNLYANLAKRFAEWLLENGADARTISKSAINQLPDEPIKQILIDARQ